MKLTFKNDEKYEIRYIQSNGQRIPALFAQNEDGLELKLEFDTDSNKKHLYVYTIGVDRSDYNELDFKQLFHRVDFSDDSVDFERTHEWITQRWRGTLIDAPEDKTHYVELARGRSIAHPKDPDDDDEFEANIVVLKFDAGYLLDFTAYTDYDMDIIKNEDTDKDFEYTFENDMEQCDLSFSYSKARFPLLIEYMDDGVERTYMVPEDKNTDSNIKFNETLRGIKVKAGDKFKITMYDDGGSTRTDDDKPKHRTLINGLEIISY